MNKPHIFLSLMALSVLSCAKVNEARDTGTQLRLVQEPVTKTHLGEGSGNFPVFWTAGDRVVVNGVVSSPLVLESGAPASEATFKVNNVEPPYDVLYPANVYAAPSNNGCLVTIPAEQTWTEGSFAEGSALMWGQSADGETPVAMKHLTGVVRLSLTSAESYIVKSLSVDSIDDYPLSGSFKIEDGELYALEGGGISLAMPEEGIALGSEPKDFYIALPPGEYPSGIEFTITGADRKVLHCQWLRPSEGADPGISVKAGSIVLFSPMEFTPDAYEIYSASDWEEFAAACNAGNWEKDWLSKDGTVHIGADFSAENLTPLNSFSGILDGRGHTITQTAATLPLVKTLKGSIRNLSLAGANRPSDPGAAGASVFVSTIEGGSIENCVNKASLSIEMTTSKIVSGVFCRTFKGGNIINCRNEGNVSIISDISTEDHPVLAGGIVGIVSDLKSMALVKDCENKGEIKVLFAKQAADKTRPVNAGYAGIVANVTSGDADKYLRIEGCTNRGNISVGYSVDPTDALALLSGTGGILGLSARLSNTGAGFADGADSQGSYYLEIDHCVNYGTVNSNLVQNGSTAVVYKIYSGGIAGALSGYKTSYCQVTSCENYGKVIPYEGKTYSRAAYCSASGGLAGYAVFTEFTDCIVKSEQIGTLKKQAFAVSTGVGLANQTIIMRGCRLFATLQLIRATDYTEKNYSLAFSLPTISPQGNISGSVVNMEGTRIENCMFGGSVSYNTKTVSPGAQSGFGDNSSMDFTASNYADYIASQSYGGNQISLFGNSWWNGN